MLEISHCPIRLCPTPARVVVRPFHLDWQGSAPSVSRGQELIRRILDLDIRAVRSELGLVYRDFDSRHWHIKQVFTERFEQVAPIAGLDSAALRPEMRELIGAYFCHEYSYAAAALMNPSVTLHPDQSGLSAGSHRIVLSLRAVGEGHISTIEFREGIVSPGNELSLMTQAAFATAAQIVDTPHTDGGAITVQRSAESNLSSTVLFPVTHAQSSGLEDLRLVRFEHDDGAAEWLGTYTAYNGQRIQSELLSTTDFRTFRLTPLRGTAAGNKGMALFPRKIGGRYAMIGRQDGRNLYLLYSDTLVDWNDGQLLLEPKHPWEYVQLGNCGSPIELDEGWLVLTHGVGAMRKYAIGAMLLDKTDPSIVLGRMAQPIVSAADEDREGYVPNVVYTCGAMRCGDQLFMPYGIADTCTAFSFVPIRALLAAM